jgi:hypothetical protein
MILKRVFKKTYSKTIYKYFKMNILKINNMVAFSRLTVRNDTRELLKIWNRMLRASYLHNPYIDPYSGTSLIKNSFRHGSEEIRYDTRPETILKFIKSPKTMHIGYFLHFMGLYYDPEIYGDETRFADDKKPELKVFYYFEQCFVEIIFSKKRFMRDYAYEVHDCLTRFVEKREYADGTIHDYHYAMDVLTDIYTRYFDDIAETDIVIQYVKSRGFMSVLIPTLIQYNFSDDDDYIDLHRAYMIFNHLYRPVDGDASTPLEKHALIKDRIPYDEEEYEDGELEEDSESVEDNSDPEDHSSLCSTDSEEEEEHPQPFIPQKRQRTA